MPKIAKELSALEVRRLSLPGHHPVGGVPGLALRVTRSGSKSWILRVTVGDKRRDLGIGGYPGVTLAAAKEAARQMRQEVRDGCDPVEKRNRERSALRALQAAQVSFAEFSKDFLKAKRPQWSNSKHAAQWESSLETYAFPVIGRLMIQDIKTEHICTVLEPIWHTKNETAKRVQNRIEQILNAAKSRGYRSGDNPAQWRGHLDHLLPKRTATQTRRHQPAIGVEQAPAFYQTLVTHEGLGARALAFQLLTATRPGEARGVKWDELDLSSKAWVIPAERMKKRKEHIIPLSTQAIALLQSTPKVEGCSLVFPGAKNRPLSDATLAAVIKRMNKSTLTWIDPKTGDPAVPHGLRSTFRDWVSTSTSFGRELAERALAHKIDPTEAAYARSSLLEQRRPMMEAWAAYLATTDAKQSGAKT